jgi:hypothetical protein
MSTVHTGTRFCPFCEERIDELTSTCPFCAESIPPAVPQPSVPKPSSTAPFAAAPAGREPASPLPWILTFLFFFGAIAAVGFYMHANQQLSSARSQLASASKSAEVANAELKDSRSQASALSTQLSSSQSAVGVCQRAAVLSRQFLVQMRRALAATNRGDVFAYLIAMRAAHRIAPAGDEAMRSCLRGSSSGTMT